VECSSFGGARWLGRTSRAVNRQRFPPRRAPACSVRWSRRTTNSLRALQRRRARPIRCRTLSHSRRPIHKGESMPDNPTSRSDESDGAARHAVVGPPPSRTPDPGLRASRPGAMSLEIVGTLSLTPTGRPRSTRSCRPS
jgi:hypothetical protein